ncbi:MAG: TatD family hydrolase [Bacteroidetes bacterium]|nr:TatD family hydrolase [Bacteroidota bacterium]
MDKLTLIDTHAHIYDERFDKDYKSVIERSLKVGVKKIYMPSINLDLIPKLLSRSKEYPNICFPMIGIHPCDIKENFKDQLQKMEHYFLNHKFCAVGEIGLDLYWEQKFIKHQIEAFEIQLKWAEKYDLPIVIHSRNAFDQTINILKKFKNKFKGIVHCFDGNYEQAKQIIDLGMYLGIGGIVTFKNSELSNTIRRIDLENIVLETDSPYLAPTPYRGKRNEPSYVFEIAKFISKLKNVSIEKVAEITTKNAENIFN